MLYVDSEGVKLGLPEIAVHNKDGIRYFTDDVLFDSCGIRIAFTWRMGGVSNPPYEGLDLATHVGDNPAHVAKNRALLSEALGASDMPLLVPNQVHGSCIVSIGNRGEALSDATLETLAEGADGITVECEGVAALLCFADCVPVIIASPDGRFSVVHSGWRGVMAEIAPKALHGLTGEHASIENGRLAILPSDCNIYIGPHICGKCFETSQDIAQGFIDKFGKDVALDGTHISLERAIKNSLLNAGADDARIVGVDACTRCRPDDFYSYRAEGGVCGRHGAMAFRV